MYNLALGDPATKARQSLNNLASKEEVSVPTSGNKTAGKGASKQVVKELFIRDTQAVVAASVGDRIGLDIFLPQISGRKLLQGGRKVNIFPTV